MARTKGPVERKKMMTILLSDEEYEQIKALAAHEGVDVSTYVRSVFRAAWRKHEAKEGRNTK